MFGKRSMELSPSVCSTNMRMLRALDLNNTWYVTQRDISNIGSLCHLKYVSIGKYSKIYALPKSIRKLRGLQNLDIRESYITALPTGIIELHSLRGLRCSRRPYFDHFDIDHPMQCLRNTLRLPMLCTPLVDPDYHADLAADLTAELHMACSSCLSETCGVRVPTGIGNLKELQILEVVDIKQTSKKTVKELGELIQLRKLSVVTGRFTRQKQKMLHLCAAIAKLSSLCSLSVDACYGGTLEWLHTVSSPCPQLKNLKLSGRLGEKTSEWVGSLKHLVKIHLEWSRLKEDQVTEMLGVLPKLILLSLGVRAHVGKKLVFREEAFVNLRKLCITYLPELREVRFQKGASPQLELLEFNDCYLESGIIGIKHLPRLKQIQLSYKGRVAKLGVLQAEVDAHPNHPVLQLKQDLSEHDLGDIVQGCDDVEAEEEPSLFSEPATVGESSSQAMNLSQDHDIGDDDFLSCISDDVDAS